MHARPTARFSLAFFHERITWNNISIVDPLLTIPVIIFISVAITKNRRQFSFLAVGWIVSIWLGLVQYERAFHLGLNLPNLEGIGGANDA